MARLRLSRALCALVGLAAGPLACGGDNLVLPSDGEVTGIAAVRGAGQTGRVGVVLPQELVVRVSDALGRPVEGRRVAFLPANGGRAAPDTATTDASGEAAARWLLGPAAGSQELRAVVVGAGDVAARFSATATAGGGAALQPVSGDGQRAAVSSALPESLVVRVSDAFGNPAAGVTVAWTAAGGGSVSPASVTTGADGRAAAERVLGPAAGEQSAEASVAGLAGSPVVFRHTAQPANPTRLLYVSGNGQSAPAGFMLPESLVVRLVDDNDNGVGGRSVTWVVGAGGGSAQPVNSTTNPQGYAFTRWTLGTTSGDKVLNAVFSGLPTVPFAATATPDAPTRISLHGGNDQSGTVGATLPTPLSVRVVDANGNPVQNVSVTWAAGGGARASATTTGTDAGGVARVSLTLGTTPGDYTTTATVAGLSGSPVTFTSHARPGAPDRLAFAVQPATTTVGRALPEVRVAVHDVAGNVVTTSSATITVALGANPAGATLSGSLSVAAVNGVAVFRDLVIDRAGSGYTLVARASRLDDATSAAFDVARVGTETRIVATTPEPSVTGQPVTIRFRVTNAIGADPRTPTGSVTVTDGAQSCSGALSGQPAEGSCELAFAPAGERALVATYAGDATFLGSDSPEFRHDVDRAATTTTIDSILPELSVVGEEVTVYFTVAATAPGAGTPTGTVEVTANGSLEGCTGTAAAGSCSFAPFLAGTRTFRAAYQGDAGFAPSEGARSHEVQFGGGGDD